MRQVAGLWGRLDTVIANAGFSPPGTLEDHDFWDWRGGRPAATPALTTEQVAKTILFAISQPEGVDVNHLVVRPAGQVG